jgi:hypothetical protein
MRGILCLLTLLTACGSRAVVYGDGGDDEAGPSTQDGCFRPLGTCLSTTDCGAAEECAGPWTPDACCPMCHHVLGVCRVAAKPSCSTNSQCQGSEFCNVDGNCPQLMGVPGFCQVRPGLCDDEGSSCGCPTIYSPVCGCDNTTYDNECRAHSAGVSIAFKGICS